MFSNTLSRHVDSCVCKKKNKAENETCDETREEEILIYRGGSDDDHIQFFFFFLNFAVISLYTYPSTRASSVEFFTK